MLLRDPRSLDPSGVCADSLWSSNPAELIDHARRTIEHDPCAARRYLDRLALVFGNGNHRPIEKLLVPALPDETNVGTMTRGGLAPWQLQRVSDYVEERLGDTIVLDGLAGVVRLSTGHFCRAFKVTVGETPHAFLIRRRIRRAQTLMLTTKDSLSHIACTCGLTDQAHLTRLFRRMVGDTPLSWRRTWSHMFERGELGSAAA
ncbi:MAG: AraC family transcriptional regulator [Pseudomonadota bacterium]|jgi:AraC-like DNA-binding protein